jgi:polyisoprenoid-binding protein YceI
MVMNRKKLTIFLTVLCIFNFKNFAMADQARVDLSFHLFPAGSFHAKTANISGGISKPQSVRGPSSTGSVLNATNIVVDLKSLKTGIALRDRHLQEYLETDKYPTAVLLEARGANGHGKGKIKIRNIVKEVNIEYKVVNKMAEGNFKINISDFKIKEPKYMGVGVDDEVEVNIVLPLVGI